MALYNLRIRNNKKSFHCQQILLYQLHKRQKYGDMRGCHVLLLLFENLRLTLTKKHCQWECNKTIIFETICVFPFGKTSGYHLKVFVYKLNQIRICQTTIVEKHLRQNYVRMNSMSKLKSWQSMVHFARG